MLGGVLLVTILVYLRALGNGFVYDDRTKIRVNDYIGQWSFLWQSLLHDEWWFQSTGDLPWSSRYRPLSDIWFGLNYHLFGLNPAGWHAATLGVHLIAVWLLFRLALRLTGDRPVSLLACLLFAVMPVHVQAVVWTSAIGLLLAATLETGALCLFASRAGSRFKLPLALILYAGALLSHESAVAFPGLIGLYVFLLESAADAENGKQSIDSPWPRARRALAAMSPFAAAMLLYLIARRLVLGAFINTTNSVLPVGAARVLMTIPRVVLTDLAVMIAPSTAGLAHRQLFVSSPGSVDFVRSPASLDFLGPVAVLAVLALVFLRSVRNHPRRRLYLFCAGWILIAIAPMMNLGAITHFLEVQDDYLYLASAGWCVMFGDCVVRFVRAGRSMRRNLAWTAIAALVAVYLATVWSLEPVWHDNRALFARCIEDLPEAVVCHGALGVALKLEGDLPGAERELTEAIHLDRIGIWTWPFDLAQTYGREGRFAEACAELDRSIKMSAEADARDYVMLAKFRDLAGQSALSEAALKRAEAEPDGIERAGLARAEIRMWHRDDAGAEAILRGLAARYPGNYQVWDEMGAALADQKRYDESLSDYKRAIDLEPNEMLPRLFTAKLLHSMGRDREALEQCRAALAIEPNDGDAQALAAGLERSLRTRMNAARKPRAERRLRNSVPAPAAISAAAGNTRMLLAGVSIATVLLYLPSLRNGWIYDDRVLLIDNREIGKWPYFWKVFVHDEIWFFDPSRLPQSSRYRPLSNLWYALQYHLFGLNPVGSHAAEIALHLAAVLLVFKVAERLTRDRIAALLACALFAVHPVHVQTVVWTAAIGLLLVGVLESGRFIFSSSARDRVGEPRQPGSFCPRAPG